MDILQLVHSYLKVNDIQMCFGALMMVEPFYVKEKAINFVNSFAGAFANLSQEGKENVVRQYLLIAAATTNKFQLHTLMIALKKLAETQQITAKLLCDKILACEMLVYENKHFWLEGFEIIKSLISQVDYKGVREIMKVCRDKALTFPCNVNTVYLTQLYALESTIEYIFDRNNCLLPAYFVANEIMKPFPYHWKLNKLMLDFVEEFRNTAQMVSIIGHSHMLPIVEHFGYADHMMNSWKLDHNTLKFMLKGSLPCDQDLLDEQTQLLRYVLRQPYSKEMISVMLNLQKQQKQRCNALEEQFVNLIITAMEMTELNDLTIANSFKVNDELASNNEWMWLHLSSQLIYFVLFQYVSFMHIVMALYDKLSNKDLRKGRDHLMWILLQFISGSIQKNPIANFLPMFKLFELLYPEKEPMPLPDCNQSSSLRQMAPICIWIHLMKKARVENMNINRPLPIALKNHHEFIQHLVMPSTMMSMSLGSDFRIILICNAYSTNQEYFARPMNILVEALNGNVKTPSGAQVPSVPFSMVVLDSLTVHSKMSLIHSFVTSMMKNATTKNQVPAPAFVETYARLLVYTEIESLGIKGFLVQLLPTVFKHQAWGILHTLLEMFSYRLHHIPTHYRVQLLSTLHSLAAVPQTNKMQLNVCFESTALRLITGLGSAEVQPQLSRYFNEKPPASVASNESEELNRVLILTLARSMHITGSGDELQAWCKDLLGTIMLNTPHTWSAHTLSCFPPALNEFFVQNSPPAENKQLLKKTVEEEYRNWTSMSNENDIIAHFLRSNTNALFLCLLFKMISETENVTPVAYKILEGISARALSAHLRKLCDYIVALVSTPSGNDVLQKCVDTLNSMIWKYHVVTIDRLVLCLSLRNQEGNEAQVSFLIIQVLLLKTPEFRVRMVDFCQENSPDHWKQNNWHDKHLSYHQKFPEKFAPDESASQPPLPVFFCNVILRMLPVLDIVIHRYIELPNQHVHQILDVMLEHLGALYKFHYRPLTYVYNTLHYYEHIFRDRPALKKRFVGALTGAFNEIRPHNWCLSDDYIKYLNNPELLWNPDPHYYMNMIARLTDTISGKKVFYNTDWRFNEFPNAPSHALYVTCIELLALPIAPSIVTDAIIEAVTFEYSVIPLRDTHAYVNTVGIILAALPEAYWRGVYDNLQDVLNSAHMFNWNYRCNLFELLNFNTVYHSQIHKRSVMVLAIAHSVFHHMGCFKLAYMTRYLKDKLKPCIATEEQLLYLCHVFGPFLQRIEQETPNAVAGIAILLYELLEVVDKHHGHRPLIYIDPICDFLYHIKYIHVGNIIKNESEAIIKRLRPALQRRLRFITHLNLEDIQPERSIENSQLSHSTISQSMDTPQHQTEHTTPINAQMQQAQQQQNPPQPTPQQKQQQLLLQQQQLQQQQHISNLMMGAMIGGPQQSPQQQINQQQQQQHQQQINQQQQQLNQQPQQTQLNQQQISQQQISSQQQQQQLSQQQLQQMQHLQQQQHHMQQMQQQQQYQLQQQQMQQHMQHMQQQQLQMQQQQQQQQNIGMRHN